MSKDTGCPDVGSEGNQEHWGCFTFQELCFFLLCLDPTLHHAQVCDLKTKEKGPAGEQSGRGHRKPRVGGPTPTLVLAEEQTHLPGTTKIQLFMAVGQGLKSLQSVSVHTGDWLSSCLSRTFHGPCGQNHGYWVPKSCWMEREGMFEDRGWPHPEQVGKGGVMVTCSPETLF